MSLVAGEIFAGYTVERELGSGGMGSVYLARHPRLPRYDALKLLRAELCDDPAYVSRFEREAETVAQLDHPNIVAVHDRGSQDGQLWISMRFIDGTTAERAIAQSARGMDPERAVHIVGRVASALDYAHRRNLLHRDVKPANILLTTDPDAVDEDGHAERVFLTDFGVAKAMGVGAERMASLTSTGNVVATLDYASPEQIRGQTLDHRSDIYALGCVLYKLLTGSVPYPGDSVAARVYGHLNKEAQPPSALVPGLPAALDAVVAKAMAKSADDRYSSCRALAVAAREALAGRQPPGSLPDRRDDDEFPTTLNPRVVDEPSRGGRSGEAPRRPPADSARPGYDTAPPGAQGSRAISGGRGSQPAPWTGPASAGWSQPPGSGQGAPDNRSAARPGPPPAGWPGSPSQPGRSEGRAVGETGGFAGYPTSAGRDPRSAEGRPRGRWSETLDEPIPGGRTGPGGSPGEAAGWGFPGAGSVAGSPPGIAGPRGPTGGPDHPAAGGTAPGRFPSSGPGAGEGRGVSAGGGGFAGSGAGPGGSAVGGAGLSPGHPGSSPVHSRGRSGGSAGGQIGAPGEPRRTSTGRRRWVVLALVGGLAAAAAAVVVVLILTRSDGTAGGNGTDRPATGTTVSTVTGSPVPGLPHSAPLAAEVLIGSREVDGAPEMHAINVDSGAVGGRLTVGAPGPQYPILSPDRGSVIYVQATGGGSQLRTMAVDGTGDRLLFDRAPEGCANPFRPAWNPVEQTVIALVCEGSAGNQMLLVTVDGELRRSIDVGLPVFDDVAYSPDGKLITYWGNSSAANGGSIYVQPADGSAPPRAITSGNGTDADPVFSPDGQQIAFRRATPDGSTDIYLVNVDGSNLVQLTDGRSVDQDPSFSPSGTEIAFKSNRPDATGASADQLWVMGDDGSGVRQIAPAAPGTANGAPAWGHR